MTRKTPVNIGASVRARLLNVAMLFAVRIDTRYRPTRDLDLLSTGDPSEAAIHAAVREIATTNVEDDGVVFDVDELDVHAIREENKYGGMRAIMQAGLGGARIHVQIDIGFGDAITPPASGLTFPTLLAGMPSPNVLAYAIETIVAEKAHAMIERGMLNGRMKDFADVAMAARRVAFHGDTLVASLGATFHRRGTPLPDGEIVPLSDRFVQDARAQANWKAFARRNQPTNLESLAQAVAELRLFLMPPLDHAQKQQPFGAMWEPGGTWE